ncbi:uncharacterized protein MONOS_7384 [Monocercomonoides exilis]|uniref:uncharacterized protein n=1 Tax=Monocercomonoides exilis TaxID=2049356 RepID=UPI0035597947|nr:hypothetical protein MONOS_7384 [Monocercomonoides exilis]|eukprot:MONOS_7384.1-p1 / transcript=MONOS_7384.1 / gene=MONOS_7384 / organism=Monocercomonoides_exilis_PA203 / gene_product=unspecified product / transcript_product=unspecified product / location=Mono_scaffold00251:3861-9197(-) / protein_length=1715 / sequence_SO=supercontig / SO=protein_coding / is_pseudo=false
MVTLSFFRIDTSTQEVNRISKYLCYLDGSSLGYLAGTSISFVLMGCAAYFVLLVVYLVSVAIFQGAISGSQPWVISLLRWIVNVTYTILFIPFTSICITAFDCYEYGGQMIRRESEGTCLSGFLSILGFDISVVVLCFQLISSFLINNMIYNHNPKHGGLWSSPSGQWQAVDSSLVFGCVFAMRTLIEWPFWRGVVTVGTSLAMIIYFVYIQPIYKLSGNLLMGSKWCLFGCLRLIDEIVYAIEGATHNWIVTIVLQALALIAGIVVCVVLLPKIGRKMREKKYLLTAFGNQLSDICTKNPSLALPPLKKPERVEASLRFIQQKEYNSMMHLTFADYVYTHALKTNMNNCMLCFQYASFLSAYRKNYIKANTLIQKARTLSPNLFLNFVLFCKAKENGGRTNGDNRNGTGDMNSFAFTSLLAKAEKHHELAVSAMKDFFENMTVIQPDYKMIPVFLNSIAKNEGVARKSYEELIASHGQNSEVLRRYARLLLDIYNEEDEAELILNRADLIEEESVGSSESMSHTHTMGLHEASFGTGEEYEAGDQKGEENGNGKMSARGDYKAEFENNNIRTVRRGNFEVTAGSVYEGTNADKGADGKDGTDPSSCDALHLDGDQESLARSEKHWQHSSNEVRRHHMSNKKKRRKKKKDAAIVDLMMGGRGANGNRASNMILLKATVISLHFIDIIALIVALVVYVVMTNTYQNNLDILRNVCDLSYHTARSAAIGYNFFVYDQRYNFSDPPKMDDWPSGMIQKKDLMKMLEDTSDNLATMLGDIHQSTSNLEVWETADISTYFFIITTKNETQGGETTEVIDTKTQILSSSSMLEVLATISQITHHLRLSNISSRPQDPEYIPNIQYLVFNCPVPILDGAKRVIIYYFGLMNTECTQIITAFSIIIAVCLPPLTIALFALFIIFTKKTVRNRMRAYQTLLDVPKNKMQSVIRRLLRDEEEVDDFAINIATSDDQEMKQYEGNCDSKGEFLEDPGASASHEGADEGAHNDFSKNNGNNSIQTFHLSSSSLAEINVNSMPTQQLSMKSQDDISPINTNAIESAYQELEAAKNSEDFGMAETKAITNSSSSLISFHPLIGGNSLSVIQMSKPLIVDHDDDTSNFAHSPLIYPSLYSGNGNQLNFGQLSTSSLSMQHSASECESGFNLNSMHSTPRLSSPNLYMSNKALLLSQNAFPQVEKSPMTPTAKDHSMKSEQSTSDINGTPVQAQQNGVIDAKYNLDDDDSEESEKNKLMGLVRNAVEDAAWEEQMEKEIEKHEAAYKQLPSPITTKIKVAIILSAALGVVTTAATITLVCVYVTKFKPTSANIILSGMRASILFQIQFLLTSILQPIPMLKTDQSIFFPRSYNPVMYNSSHCSGSQITARDMLVPMSNYFEAVHLDVQFGDSDYTHANDYTYDTISVERMSTEFNHETLLQKADCYLADSEDCSQAESNRMYGIRGTIYGLNSLLSRMRINLERISKMDVSEITFLTSEARFILNALRNDIVGGINRMTNMILESGKKEVQDSVAILIIVVVCLCVLFLISMFGNGLIWIGEISFIESVSGKLRKLLPIAEGEKEIEMMSSMITGHESFDKGREAVLDTAQQLLTSINQNDDFETVVSAFYQLSSTALAVFNEEEREMVAKNYAGIEKHKREHLLLRQRLTLIGDQLRSKNDAVKAVGKRKLISLFDMHFTDEDITFADAVFKTGSNEQKNGENDNNNDM